MFVWFSRRLDLTQLESEWEDSGSNFDPEQPVDAGWHVDHSATVLGPAAEDGLFDAAVRQLFSYGCYPPGLLVASATFVREGRPPLPGDRVIQRIQLVPGLLDAVTMHIVSAAWFEQNRRGFTLHTSERHFEIGELTASVTRKPGGAVSYLCHSVSRPGPKLPRPAQRWARRLQRRAQRLGPAYFQAAVAERRLNGQASPCEDQDDRF